MYMIAYFSVLMYIHFNYFPFQPSNNLT
uniref:Uncharacterized protein n=1 Tax=Anguilla anguilla TaxID=7936 RepID=A0A0E9S463_ANGAN